MALTNVGFKIVDGAATKKAQTGNGTTHVCDTEYDEFIRQLRLLTMRHNDRLDVVMTTVNALPVILEI